MMKIIYSFILSAFLCTNIFSQLNIEKLGQLSYSDELSDVWSYNASDGSEYALVGVFSGLSIVNVTLPAAPTEVQFVTGANSSWRDIKTFQNYAYVTNESDNGVLIVDLQFLPDSVQYVNYQNAGDNNFASAHNLYIDEFGFMYIAGHNLNQRGVLIYDLNNTPMKPQLVGVYNNNYVHDVYAKNNIMYTSEGNQFAIVDVADKANWEILGTQNTFGYTHNAWLSDDSNTLFTTDETAGTWVVAWDISDPSDIKELNKVQSSPGENVIPHNTHVLNDFLITSYYTDGVVIFDASEPANLIEIANFDTAPDYSGGGFNGCWGATPFLNSGNILATDIEQGLYILKANYKRAARLQGTVLEVGNSNPINNANILLVDKGVIAYTNEAGFYSTGLSNGDEVKVEFSAIGYFNLDTTITLANNNTRDLNVNLVRKPSFSMSFNVIDANDTPLENADVFITNGTSSYNLQTTINGSVSIDSIFEGEYDLYAGKWGYYTQKLIENITPNNNSLQVKLGEGYYDDFTFDYGWINNDSQTASAGLWERGIPIGTTFEDQIANIDTDFAEDYNNICLITGNGGGQAGADDVDNGSAVIESPEFKINYWDNSDVMPMLSYAFYFFNDGGQGNPPPTPNDYFKIYLINGKFEVLIDSISVSSGGWQNNTINVKEFITTDNLEKLVLKLVCSDNSPGHIVEAAFDRFELTYEIFNNVIDFNLYTNNISVTCSSNPFTEQINFNFQPINNALLQHFNVKIYNSLGLAVDDFKLNNNTTIAWGNSASLGIYHLIVTYKNQPATYLKFIKQ